MIYKIEIVYIDTVSVDGELVASSVPVTTTLTAKVNAREVDEAFEWAGWMVKDRRAIESFSIVRVDE